MDKGSAAFSVSIIICSCNRAAVLQQTLEAFRSANVPADWWVELIVVDNASTDNTSAVLENFQLPTIPIRPLTEPRRGKAHALNTGLAAARGKVLLFTDDDVRPAQDWIERLPPPLFQGQCDAAVGKILLAPHLSRSWLRDEYKRWLAWCETPQGEPLELIGANMGIRRHVLTRVPTFDPELGPGATGLGEDTLFGWQLVNAGYTVKFLADSHVTHHSGASRLLRSSWLQISRSNGRGDAYIRYHWKHEKLTAPRLRSIWLKTKLWLRRILQPPVSMDSEGCSRWEMSYVGQIEMYEAYRSHTKRRRNY